MQLLRGLVSRRHKGISPQSLSPKGPRAGIIIGGIQVFECVDVGGPQILTCESFLDLKLFSILEDACDFGLN